MTSLYLSVLLLYDQDGLFFPTVTVGTRGTRDQITNLRILMHKAREHQQPLYMCFVDFKKAFDSISHDKLWI